MSGKYRASFNRDGMKFRLGNYGSSSDGIESVRRLNFVCFKCRRSKKGASGAKCGCGRDMVNMGERFRVPPRQRTDLWKQSEERVRRNAEARGRTLPQ